MKMTTAIFDLDGTLLNTLGDLCDSVTYAVEKHGFPPVSMEQTRIRIGNGVRKLVERSIPEESRTDEMIDICLADFRAFYGEHMMNRTHPYEGIVSVLETLKENGVTVGVLSNKYDSAAKALIEHYFDDLVCITYGERPNIPRKPDPTSVLGLLDELGGQKETTLYIGDSATDMQTAVNAGLTAIGVAWGFRSVEELRASGADALAYEPSDLLPLFEYGVPDVSKAEKALTGYGFGFHYFATKDEAVSYLRDTCAGKSVSMGGSMTMKQLGFPENFAGVYCQTPDVYLSSANGLSETGEIVNIDGKCNRVAATLFGPKRCIFVCGVNKLRPDLQSAIERARNIAAPLNAKRLNRKTPCAVDGRCHDCKSPERICRAMVIHMGVPSGFESCEVVLIGEKLGY